MPKDVALKYPNSANLFQFCRRVLDHKFGGIRVIDQDVGQILGFDPADCSHWKKGKKNIRSIQAMKSISTHLGLDEKLVVDVAAGEMDDTEAFYEYSGYGSFAIEPQILDAARKEFYRSKSTNWVPDKEQDFKASFELAEPEINQIVSAIHERVNFKEAPLYLPELVNAYANLQIIPDDNLHLDRGDPTRSLRLETTATNTIIRYPVGTEMRPFMRFQIARMLAPTFLGDLVTVDNGSDSFNVHLNEVRTNLFAAKLLSPDHMVRAELANVNVGSDIIVQLAETFWLSKSFMNRRIKDILAMSQT